MRIFVTGATGFIGANFVNAAHLAGYEVVALRRSNQSVPAVVLKQEPIWVEGLLDGNFLEVLTTCDSLVHFAAHSANHPYDSMENCLYWNVVATLKLCEQAHEAGIEHYLIAGSCFEYGKSGERYEFIPVNAPLEPTMTYPTSKAAASVALYGWAAQNQVKLQILRIFQVFGEGELSTRLWPSLYKSAMNGEDYSMTRGEQIRDFISVESVVKQFIQALAFNGVGAGQPVVKHVGSGKPQTVLEFSQNWWKKWGARGKLLIGDIPYRDNEIMRYVPMIEGEK
jgi:nucleoside-diphosphate-sugar epimerase